ncbi:hypothetical protein, conserved in T. vivax [Trypanosoma vivax Y486]|uniref:Uncharacterized protein n=1 Tax=Trypanosoma vivax (strain Y486) TaxID=1055687 RepID=F9WUL4_TRYVY|nr:hypothetical protein, conserved in T. vivax [Trypanosoma vivax Y486]|eukprot:CCD21263.1 hypothetical protein, conserved in T. vivax [Trypanosoma vivax Y486]
MSVMRFFLLLLLPLCFVVHASRADKCPRSKNDISNVRMCATRDLLWGWLNVTNKTAARAEKVIQNATPLRDRADKVKVEAEKSLNAAKDVLSRLKKTNHEKIGTVVQAVKMLENVIDNVKASCKEADKAEGSANDSKNQAFNSYGHICLAANSISSIYDSGFNVHERALQRIDMIKIEGECSEEFFASKHLSDVAARLDVIQNLSAWKTEAMHLINSTYHKIAQNMSTCHWTFNNGAEKFQGVKNAIEKAVEKLEVAIKGLDTIDLTLQGAEKNVANATNEVEAVNATMLGRFKQSGTVLCDILGRRVKLGTQLTTTVGRLGDTERHTASRVKNATDMLANAIETNEIVQSVADKISQLLKSEPLPSAAKLFASRNISSANENAKRFKNVATLSAQSVSRAKESTTKVEGYVKRNEEMFERVREQLIARLNETRLNISSLTAEECNKKFSEVSAGSWEDAFDHALGINETALWETNKTLKQLEAQIELMESNLTKIDNSVRDINKAMSNAEQIRETAKTAAANAVADVLRSLMQEMCASATELHELQKKNNGLEGTAKALKNNVSVESRRAEAAWKRDNDLSGMPQEVEEGFTYASRGVAVLEKHLQRIDAQYTNVINELSQELEITEESGAKTYDVVVKFVRGINSNLADFSSPSVCDGVRVAELVQTVMKNREAMLKNVSAIVSLGELAAKVRERVTAARDQMKKAVSSAADAQAAVEEAIRRARDADTGRRCTPLHRQLLNVLRHIW